MKAAFACVGLSLALASCIVVSDRKTEVTAAHPSIQAPQIRGALSGQRQRLVSFYAIAADCSSLGYPTLREARPPQHGQISIEQGTAIAGFGKDDPRDACNGKIVPATVVYYMSEPDFIGDDSAALERIGVAGAYGFHEYTIKVR